MDRYEQLLDEAIDEHRRNPVDILGIGDTGEHGYLVQHKDGFVRTVHDVDEWCQAHGGAKRILEIGAFLGTVSVTLKGLGHDVSAVELPEYAESPRLQAYFQRHGVSLHGANLRDHSLPFDDATFDVVVICEVIEHLNFNPLPMLQELNRIMRTGALLYIGMPNHVSIRNRVRVLTGRSLHNPIVDYVNQLDPTENVVAALHWREYTLPETKEMIGRVGFTTERSWYFYERWRTRNKPIKRIAKTVLFAYPPLRPYQVVMAVKERDSDEAFWLTGANS